MKKLILATALANTTIGFAQDKKVKREPLTPEQQTELQVKKMTLDLDLDTKQQKEMKVLLLEQAKKREAKVAEMKAKREKGEKPTSDERFEAQNQMLDNQIENKAKIKKILNPDQYKKWEEQAAKRSDNRKERMEKRAEKRSTN